MWIVAVLSDGPLRGRRFEVEAQAGRAPRELLFADPDAISYTYSLTKSNTRARHWSYAYADQAQPADEPRRLTRSQ
jgi:hypothetical protein